MCYIYLLSRRKLCFVFAYRNYRSSVSELLYHSLVRAIIAAIQYGGCLRGDR